jgi:hypothetical protein
MSDHEVNRIDYLSSRQEVVPDLYPVPLPPQSPSALNPQDRRSMRCSNTCIFEDLCSIGLPTQRGAFGVISWWYLECISLTPEVVQAKL